MTAALVPFAALVLAVVLAEIQARACARRRAIDAAKRRHPSGRAR